MANYIINECITNDEYIISAENPLTLGSTIEFDISESRFCATVGEVTTNPETLNIRFIKLYDDCCTCLSGITISEETLNFTFTRCGTSEEINIESTNFCREYGVPTTGITYEIQFGSETPFCATFEGLSPTGTTNYHYVSGPFSLCEDCGEEPPRSAGTEYEICEICCDCGATGSTINLITPPHPVYTDGYGTPVTQLNMVVLGGPNGLNS
jgi:hypothetical protein